MALQVLPLHAPVEETAEMLQFVKKKSVLKVLSVQLSWTAGVSEVTTSLICHAG